ncbi:MAG TPA: thioesterase family protein [Solirubrobacterales bacterium]
MPDSFYEPDDEGFRATELTRGPWDRDSQHAGPPAALLGRALERLPGAEGFQVGRVTFEILRPVPIGPVRIATRLLRPGRRVQLVEAELSAEGEPLMRATAWLVRVAEIDLPGESPTEVAPPPGPERGSGAGFFPTEEEHGYHSGMEISFISGGFMEQGPATVWLRMRSPLLPGEEPTPLQRLLIAADVGNGVSSTLDFRRFLFLNVELTVHLERLPEGEWVGLDAVTLPQPSGVGIAESVLFDERGRLGRAAQTLLISER